MADIDLLPRFNMLAAWWQTDTEESSSVNEILHHPAYERIISLGDEVVPLILESYREKIDHWAPALAKITGENPVTKELAGKMDEVRDAWIKWGIDMGYIK